MINQRRTPKMQARSPNWWWARVEIKNKMILKPTLASSSTWQQKCPSLNNGKQTHPQAAIRLDRDKGAAHQEATGSLKNMHRSLCLMSKNVQILSFVHSTKNITPRNFFRTGSESQNRYAAIHWMQKTICSRMTEMMTKVLHPMNHLVMGMWWIHISARKKCQRWTSRSSPQSKMIVTILGEKGLPLHLGKHKKRWDCCWGMSIHRPSQSRKHKTNLRRHHQTRVHPWAANYRTLHQTTRTSVLPQTPW